MANTYTQIYIQIVFTVQGKRNLIPMNCRDELYKYITGIVTNRGQKLIRINGMPDHLHILIGLQPSMAISNLVRDIKAISSKFVNEKNWVRSKFNWQVGFGAFSYGHSQLNRIIHYIDNQAKHHQKRSFKEEYIELLRKFKIDFDEKYLFELDD